MARTQSKHVSRKFKLSREHMKELVKLYRLGLLIVKPARRFGVMPKTCQHLK